MLTCLILLAVVILLVVVGLKTGPEAKTVQGGGGGGGDEVHVGVVTGEDGELLLLSEMKGCLKRHPRVLQLGPNRHHLVANLDLRRMTSDKGG